MSIHGVISGPGIGAVKWEGRWRVVLSTESEADGGVERQRVKKEVSPFPKGAKKIAETLTTQFQTSEPCS